MPRLASTIAGLQRWRSRWRATGGTQGQQAAAIAEDPLLAIGRTLRERREARGLNLREMAQETRISTPVLEALERGWRDRLPEATYLRTMLPLLEQRLELAPGSLDGALPVSSAAEERRQRKAAGLLQRFTPGSIDVFSTWQGTLLYGGLTLGLIYLINLQQQQLAAANQLSLRPIPPLPLSEQRRPPSPAAALLARYPELRPLRLASRGQALAALQHQRLAPGGNAPASGPGVLRLHLSRASSVELQSDSGTRSSLKGAQGELDLQLQPPLELRIQPAPVAGEVNWNGKALVSIAGEPGRYRQPVPASSAATGRTTSESRP